VHDVLLSNGDGTFQSAIGSAGPPNSTITSLHVFDVNDDGNLDLIVTGKQGSSSFVATMIGNGNGRFQAPINTLFVGSSSPNAVFGDFNADGILDFAFLGASSIQTMLGNGDGKLDLVASVYDPFTTGFFEIGVFPGNGDGTFGAVNIVPGSGTSYVGAITAAIGDFNGDGILDIASAYQTVGPVNQGFITVSLGNGDGTFQSGYSVPNVRRFDGCTNIRVGLRRQQ
jgi:hypothetical protein